MAEAKLAPRIPSGVRRHTRKGMAAKRGRVQNMAAESLREQQVAYGKSSYLCLRQPVTIIQATAICSGAGLVTSAGVEVACVTRTVIVDSRPID